MSQHGPAGNLRNALQIIQARLEEHPLEHVIHFDRDELDDINRLLRLALSQLEGICR